MAVVDDHDEAPLDPAAERLRRKLVRLLLVSGGIMFAGLIAVFAAIVYKLGESAPAGSDLGRAGAAAVEARIAVPPGSRIAATALDGGRALVTLEGPGGATTLVLVDLGSGTVIGRYVLEAE